MLASQVSSSWARVSPCKFMWALVHHYGIKLQHFSSNASSNATIFVAVCEGYLGMRPHWELWLHLFKGKLFEAPAGDRGVRKTVRAGCLNLVLKSTRSGEPCECIPTGLMSYHASGTPSGSIFVTMRGSSLPTPDALSQHAKNTSCMAWPRSTSLDCGLFSMP